WTPSSGGRAGCRRRPTSSGSASRSLAAGESRVIDGGYRRVQAVSAPARAVRRGARGTPRRWPTPRTATPAVRPAAVLPGGGGVPHRAGAVAWGAAIPGRLVAGQRTLNPSTEVRILPREPTTRSSPSDRHVRGRDRRAWRWPAGWGRP